MEKRTKYYFGLIPANQGTHQLMLIAFSMILIMSCTCWKYFRLRKSKIEDSKTHKHTENCRHDHLKELRPSSKKTK